MTSKTREEVQAEVDAINSMAKASKAVVLPCRECDGAGYRDSPLFGDPYLGCERLLCSKCNGTGSRLKFGAGCCHRIND